MRWTGSGIPDGDFTQVFTIANHPRKPAGPDGFEIVTGHMRGPKATLVWYDEPDGSFWASYTPSWWMFRDTSPEFRQAVVEHTALNLSPEKQVPLWAITGFTAHDRSRHIEQHGIPFRPTFIPGGPHEQAPVLPGP